MLGDLKKNQVSFLSIISLELLNNFITLLVKITTEVLLNYKENHHWFYSFD